VACVVTLCAHTGVAAPASHIRLRTEHGSVHVYRPALYDRDSAGIVVYVHGFFTNVDEAWREHRLARQFAASGLNALFIACEAPDGPRDDVRWASIDELLAEVSARLDDELPRGRVIAVGHSGAHRTLRLWLADTRLDTIVLVDALYGDVEQFKEWLAEDVDHRLIDAAVLTRPWADELHAELADTLTFERFPPSGVGKLRGARHARVVYVRSQHDHMKLVTGGVALPMLLRAAQLPTVGQESNDAP
jgi:hypothetical protein